LLLDVQVVILIIIPKMAGSRYLNTKNVLKFVVIFQYVPRFMRIYPLYKEVTTSGILTETAWAGAAFNLFLYMLASHVSLIYSTGIHFIVK
jgi:cyclic nucleotide gated channel